MLLPKSARTGYFSGETSWITRSGSHPSAMPAGHACRRAVFFPTIGNWSEEGDATAFARVQTLWRQRLPALRDAHWKPILSPKFQYARNCLGWGSAEHRPRKILAEAVGRVCSYPAGILTSPIRDMLPLFSGFNHVRMLNLF